MEARKENKCPFDLSEDGPPALPDGIRNTHEEKRKDRTDMIHGAMIWNAVINLMDCRRARH